MSIEMSIVSNFGMLQSEIKDFPPITQEIDQADFGSNAVEASPHKPVKFMPYAVSLGDYFTNNFLNFIVDDFVWF